MKKDFNLPNIQVIINADDFGWAPERDQGIAELFKLGKIQSSSVLMNGYNLHYVTKMSYELNIPLGLHLNLTEGLLTQELSIEALKQNSLGLHDIEPQQKYVMHGKYPFFDKIGKGLIDKNDIYNEINSQIFNFCKLFKKLPTHCDGHMHINSIPMIAEIMAFIMTEIWGIYLVRISKENLKLFNIHNEPIEYQLFKQKVVEQSAICKKIFNENNVQSAQYFIGMSLMGKNFEPEKITVFLKDILQKKEEEQGLNSESIITIECMCHPGYATKNFGDQFYQSKDREYEFHQLKHSFIEKAFQIDNARITFLSYQNIQVQQSKNKSAICFVEFLKVDDNTTFDIEQSLLFTLIQQQRQNQDFILFKKRFFLQNNFAEQFNQLQLFEKQFGIRRFIIYSEYDYNVLQQLQINCDKLLKNFQIIIDINKLQEEQLLNIKQEDIINILLFNRQTQNFYSKKEKKLHIEQTQELLFLLLK